VTQVRLVAGDVLYLPACWWHCVEGSAERNMILNWWVDRHPREARNQP
jgi:ribosomal protein L16 Arg81 hydroxylase